MRRGHPPGPVLRQGLPPTPGDKLALVGNRGDFYPWLGRRARVGRCRITLRWSDPRGTAGILAGRVSRRRHPTPHRYGRSSAPSARSSSHGYQSQTETCRPASLERWLLRSLRMCFVALAEMSGTPDAPHREQLRSSPDDEYFTLNPWINHLISNKSAPGERGGLFTRWFGSRREAGRLARDAATIIEAAQAVSSSERIRDIALRIRDDLDTAHARADDDPTRYAPIIDHFRTQHREARRRRDDSSLTALTLIIIYLRAERLGADAEPARSRIDAFLSEWTRVQVDMGRGDGSCR